MIAAVSAVALFVIMFLFSWFNIEAFGESEGFNAWQSFDIIDFVLLLTIIAAIAAAALSANAQTVNGPVALSAIVTGLGVLSLVLILFRILSPPDFSFGGFGVEDAGGDVGRSFGVFLGLIATGALTYGGWIAMQEEGTSFGGQADNLRGGPPPPP
jgi:hypothetical protein